MPYAKQINTQYSIFWFFTVLYAISFLLPVSQKLNYGFWACAWATMSMLEGPGLFIGGLANFVIAFILLNWLIEYLRKSPEPFPLFKKIINIFFILTGSSSVIIWLFIWDKDLYIGYYIWALSVIGMCISHFNYKNYRQHQYIKSKSSKDIIEHLIEE